MSVSLKGFHEKYVTFSAGKDCTVGSPVEITGDNTVADCSSGGFAGVCAAREGDLALVQVSGYVVLPAAGGLALGTGNVSISEGKVGKATTGGRAAIVTALGDDGTAELVLL